MFALMLPVFLALGGFVIGIGNWYVHGKHLQTKADAGAFGGGVSWAFPCAQDIDSNIDTQARLYAGQNNPQVGGVADASIHTVLNGTLWYDDDSNPFPQERNSPLNPSICDARVLDVKVTEDNSFPLASLIPLFPDIKRKARVEVREAQGISGLLPIGVRLPKPESAAAVFYNELTGAILDVKYFCEVPGGFGGLPAGLGGWTTLDVTNPQCNSWASVNIGQKTGVVVATSVRPACGFGTPPGTAPCLEDSGWVGQPVNTFCRQAAGTVQCWDASGSGSTQNVQYGVQYIRGYGTTGNGNGPPNINSVFLAGAPAGCGGAYFNSIPSTCSGTTLTVKVNLGTLTGTYPSSPGPPPGPPVVGPLEAQDVEVTYMLGRSDGSTQCSGYPASCQLTAANPNAQGVVTFTTSPGNAPQFTADSQANGFGIQVRVRNTTNLSTGNCASFNNACRFFYIGSGATPVNQNQANDAAELVASPIQRSFSGSVDRTGPLKWLRMSADTSLPCDSPNLGLTETGEAASVPAGPNCFYLEMGLQGSVARDQDEPPIAFNLGATGSQRALLDCDPGWPNLSQEIQYGCTPVYARHTFTYTPYCPADNNPAALLGPHGPPWDASNNWPPPQCVVTQTGAANQVMQGFNQRLFGVNNNPTCPAETSNFVPGRNYWHDANNMFDNFTFAQDSPAPARGNRLKLSEDPRYVTLFFTTYDSFTSPGNETFPIVGFGGFYVTGYGRTTAGGGAWQGGAPEDPCTGGNSGNPNDGIPFGVGNEPPPDLNLGQNQTWVWGHFITPVLLTNNGTPSGNLCNPTGGRPCIVTLVE